MTFNGFGNISTTNFFEADGKTVDYQQVGILFKGKDFTPPSDSPLVIITDPDENWKLTSIERTRGQIKPSEFTVRVKTSGAGLSPNPFILNSGDGLEITLFSQELGETRIVYLKPNPFQEKIEVDITQAVSVNWGVFGPVIEIESDLNEESSESSSEPEAGTTEPDSDSKRKCVKGDDYSNAKSVLNALDNPKKVILNGEKINAIELPKDLSGNTICH